METAAALSCAAAPWPTKVALVLHNQVSPRDFLETVCQKFREGVVQPPRGGKRGGSDACDAIEIPHAALALRPFVSVQVLIEGSSKSF